MRRLVIALLALLVAGPACSRRTGRRAEGAVHATGSAVHSGAEDVGRGARKVGHAVGRGVRRAGQRVRGE